MSVEAEIGGIKALLGVRSDSALAAALHLTKSNVSMWKRRGRVSVQVMRRAELMARHGQIAPVESIELIASEIALLHHRLEDTRISPAKLAVNLEQLAARARALGGDA
ncbi:hypothetical protein OVY48_10000 [Sphingobium sp. SA2]|uniref:hypothetical protein n=1 Tax=Sphingobium sp. SA2 TaxID=1524832 RepID=UPI0028C23208|nr:hypothetical protein [Sphingobium sp. SA2]MDT7533756.1 hypothetical protein [Sphingobium sp. SA2]